MGGRSHCRVRLAVVSFLASVAFSYRLREDMDNSLRSLPPSTPVPPLETAPTPETLDVAFRDHLTDSSSAVRLIVRALNGSKKVALLTARAHTQAATLLRFCTIVLRPEEVKALCAAASVANHSCTCKVASERHLRAAQRAGSEDATQALAALAWEHPRQRKARAVHVRLDAAASASHDGAWPEETPPTPSVELPAAAVLAGGDTAACKEAAALLVPLALSIDKQSGVHAAEVPVSLRRLKVRWRGHDPQDEAVRRNLEAAEMGLAWAVRARGYRELTADGVEKNLTAALADLSATAAVGDGYALFNLGYMHLRGEGTARDAAKAVELFEQAAAAGVVPALNALGVAYYNGDGAPLDKSLARSYLRRAALAGDPEAATNLAAMILGGDGEDREGWENRFPAQTISTASFDEARALLESAALRGRRGALLQLGALLAGRPIGWVAPADRQGTPHAGADDCPRGVALLRLLVEMWGPCAAALADGLRAHKAGEPRRALMHYLFAALLGSGAGMANAAHLLLSLEGGLFATSASASDSAASASQERSERREVARELLGAADALGNTDASLELADLLHDTARAMDESAGSGASDSDEGAVRRAAVEATYEEAFVLYERVGESMGDAEGARLPPSAVCADPRPLTRCGVHRRRDRSAPIPPVTCTHQLPWVGSRRSAIRGRDDAAAWPWRGA